MYDRKLYVMFLLTTIPTKRNERKIITKFDKINIYFPEINLISFSKIISTVNIFRLINDM